jgi:dinuclear metal center YbgI/SA1388 family protein
MAKAKKVALALDATSRTVQAALDQKADLLIVHHPLIFKPLKNLNLQNDLNRPLIKAIKGDLAVIAAHTNLDMVLVAQALADALELTPSGPLEAESPKLASLTVYAPYDAVEGLKSALFAAGAGEQGAYSECCYELDGLGQFRPGPDSLPYIGEAGVLEKTREIRLELTAPESLIPKIAAALRKAHPYEEPAFHFQAVKRPGPGLGLLAEWSEKKAALAFCAEKLGLKNPRWAGPDPGLIREAALLPGAGGDYILAAKNAGAKILVTGEINYHQALLAEEAGFCVLACGHYETEKPGLARLGRELEKLTRRLKATVEYIYLDDQSPWQAGIQNRP